MTDFKITPFARPPAPAPATPPAPPVAVTEAAAAAESQKVIVITDGACSGNPGPGGWGVIIRRGQEVIELHGGERDTTNNRMEITAVIEALKAIEPSEVEIISDSEYVINTMTKGWKRKANTDLWPNLDAALRLHRVTWKWVRGHNGHDDNERADELARLGIEEVRRK
jgi:ribonuclease HI